MAIMRFDPLRFALDVDQAFDELTAHLGGTWQPRLDVLEHNDRLVVQVDAAGIDPGSLDVTLENGMLTISGTRTLEQDEETASYRRREIFRGQFQRTLRVPEQVDADQTSAKYENGMLMVTLPKRPEIMPKKLTIEVAES